MENKDPWDIKKLEKEYNKFCLRKVPKEEEFKLFERESIIAILKDRGLYRDDITLFYNIQMILDDLKNAHNALIKIIETQSDCGGCYAEEIAKEIIGDLK